MAIFWSSITLKCQKMSRTCISTDCFNRCTLGVKVGTVMLLFDLRQNGNYTNTYCYHQPNYKHSTRDQLTDHLKNREDSVL